MRISALILKIAIVKNSRIKKYKNIILFYLTRYPGGVYSKYTPRGYLTCNGRVT